MRSFTKNMGCFFILASLLLICTAMKSQAAPIVFDSFRVFDQYHNLKYSRSVTNEQQEINGAGTIYFLEVPGIGDPDEWGNYTSVMQSPSDQTMSDAFGVLFRDPDFLLFFLSDTSTDPCPYPLGPNLVFEHLLPSGGYGGMFDATMYLDHGLQAQGWSATFSSGLTVPEPATFFLLGSGVGVIALLKRRSIKI